MQQDRRYPRGQVAAVGGRKLARGCASPAEQPHRLLHGGLPDLDDSADLLADAQTTFNKIANVMKDYEKTAVHVVGHTDSTGSDSYNQKLSERRAASVASFLAAHGVESSRVITWGRGETEPVGDNDTKAGRARNRRVDIVIKPIVEGEEGVAFQAPPYLGA